MPEEREGYLIACKNLFLAGALVLMCFKWAGETRWWAAAGTAAVVVGSVLLLNRKKAGCRAKVFTKEKGNLSRKIGAPDLMILFTNTVSHKMVNSAVMEAKRNCIPIARVHSSSASALNGVLKEYCCPSA